MQACGNMIPNEVVIRNRYAETFVADHKNGNVYASNAVEVCKNGDIKGTKENTWGENREENGIKAAGDGDVQMADDRNVIVLD